MISPLGSVPGAVTASWPSWRSTNVYVVGSESARSSHFAWASFHEFAAIATSFALQLPSVAANRSTKYGSVSSSGTSSFSMNAVKLRGRPSPPATPQFEAV